MEAGNEDRDHEDVNNEHKPMDVDREDVDDDCEDMDEDQDDVDDAHEDTDGEREDVDDGCEDMDHAHEEEDGTHMIYLFFKPLVLLIDPRPFTFLSAKHLLAW